MLRTRRTAFCLGAALAVGGCVDPCENDRSGTIPVEVTVTDPAGTEIAAERVTYRIDGAAAEDAGCLDLDQSGGCHRFGAGGTFDVGRFEITATLCGVEATETVEVEAGYCDHAEPEALTLVLDPAACD